MDRNVLDVGGMSCAHCENRIKKVLGNMKGVGNMAVDLKAGKVSVDYDAGQVTLDDIKSAIEEQGYEVK